MKNLIIIGARGFAREVYFLALGSKGYKTEFVVEGFLDDETEILDSFVGLPPIIDSVENYHPKKDDLFICALGNVHDKMKYSNIILNKGGIFTTLIDTSVSVLPSTNIGRGCIIMRNVILSSNVEIGDFVTVMVQSVIGHDTAVGDWSHLAPYVFLGGSSQIGAKTQLNVRATVLPGLKVGDGAVAGAGSVLIKNVEPGVTVFGNPAKNIGKFK